MLNLLDLPTELIYRIVEFLEEDYDQCYCHNEKDSNALVNLRLTNKRLSLIARKTLFSTIKILPLEPLNKDDLKRHKNALEHQELWGYVNSVEIDTVGYNEIRYVYPYSTFPPTQGASYEAKVSDEFGKALSTLKKLPNIRAVKLYLSEVCFANGFEWGIRKDFHGPAQTIRFRKAVMEQFFAALADPLAESIKDISITHLQDINDPTLVQSSYFRSVLRRLSSLTLNIVTDNVSLDTREAIELEELHDFFNQLPSTWLMPAAPGLKCLVLSCADRYFGYYPKLDLSSVHFPNLETLALSKFTIAENKHVDWITSHTGLRRLSLHDCPILVYRIVDPEHLVEKDNNNHSTLMDATITGWGRIIQLRELRWSGIFAQFQSSLRSLREFRIGYWKDHDTKTVDSDLDMFENMPFGLFRNRYKVYNSGRRLDDELYEDAEWYTDMQDDEGDDTLLGKMVKQFADRCIEGDQNKEDKAALVGLLESIGMEVPVGFSKEGSVCDLVETQW
ncbi:uncharacterized protein K452DRAFT_303117 [Aplosporella prunicola CBS 121167]|uniref:F-box domain-containing protein n=1 Tax=Aplosporella prunicola CBS 121167 TaxID=1176127 RepID=A0A6A6AVD2_9PEZI|nr:uncharacterized protein K452DRAFT_303117 [Aplosporella prunicola CBS 121167]KAF2135992.1 hypothetical protein K452DRAFT_303117 [Aplosporella prunicola CBS 121167]